MKPLDASIIRKVQTVSENVQVQLACIKAVFTGWQDINELWDYLTVDGANYPRAIQIILWGKEYVDLLEKKEEHDSPFPKEVGLAFDTESRHIADLLIQEVEKKVGPTLAAQQEEINKLKQSVLDWKDAWFKQRDATGKSYWMVPSVTYLLPGKWSPDMVKELQQGAECVDLMKRLLNGFFYLLAVTKTKAPWQYGVRMLPK
jgi:hypothetical protein